MTTKTLSLDDVKHIAKLANIPITSNEETELTSGFNQVLQVVEKLNRLDTMGIEPTHQVTGLENVFREDKTDTKKMLTQDQALVNAKKTYNGYFVVNRILE